MKIRILSAGSMPCISESKRLVIILYTNCFSVGAAVCQEFDSKLKAVGYASRSLSDMERSRCNHLQREVLALLNAIRSYEPYLIMRPFLVYTRYSSLAWVLKTESTYGIVANWSIKLSAFSKTFFAHL